MIAREPDKVHVFVLETDSDKLALEVPHTGSAPVPASVKEIVHDAEQAGLSNLRFHGHKVERPAGAALTPDSTDRFVVEHTDAETPWCFKGKSVQANFASSSTVGSVFQTKQLMESPRVRLIWRAHVESSTAMVMPKRPQFHSKSSMALQAEHAVRLV